MNCTYKDELYSVRDDGSVMRHPPLGKKPRPTDHQWTFGKINIKTGYPEIASVPVHRIVCTAFNGVAPSNGYVVDHKDTNKQNNRPENLRWVTRLENILLNPVTVKRIEFACDCTIEEWLADPAKYRDRFQQQDFSWMRAVTAEEGQVTLERLTAWAKNDKMPNGGKLGEWIYDRRQWWDEPEPVNPIVVSKTPGAVQRNWKTESEFPACPASITGVALSDYQQNLTSASIFCRNNYYTSQVAKVTMDNEAKSLYVITQSPGGIKEWALAKVTYENDLFVHESLGTFFEERGAERALCEAQGQEWTGEEGVDDYC